MCAAAAAVPFQIHVPHTAKNKIKLWMLMLCFAIAACMCVRFDTPLHENVRIRFVALVSRDKNMRMCVLNGSAVPKRTPLGIIELDNMQTNRQEIKRDDNERYMTDMSYGFRTRLPKWEKLKSGKRNQTKG